MIKGSFPSLGKNGAMTLSSGDSVEECEKINDKDEDPGFVPHPRQKMRKINTFTWGAMVTQWKSVIK